MKILKAIFAGALFLGVMPLAAAQEENPAGEDTQLRQLVDLYATATMGWNVEQRCRHLGETLDSQFAENYKTVDEFMTRLLVDGLAQKIKADLASDLEGDETFECGSDTIDYAAETFRLTRGLASNIQSFRDLANQ